MKVSIIIPVYKVEDFLEECLQSVLAQTFRDYEVILVDDGSPDGCPGICDRYGGEHPGFRVIHKENGGLSSARNAGLDAARGDYVYFLDSDDTICPELLETVVPLLDAGADMVAFRFRRLLPDGTLEPGREIQCGEYALLKPQQRLEFLRDLVIPCRIGWEAWSRIFVREKIEKYSLRFADNRKIFAEDLYFSLCYLAHAQKVLCMDSFLYHYRIRGDSIMGVQQTRSNLGRICALASAVQSHYRRFDDCSLLTEQFDSLYYQLVAGQFTFQMWASGIPPVDYRELVRKEVTDWDEMEHQLRTCLRKHRSCAREAMELRANVLFLLGGSELALRLRCRLLRMFRKEK